MCKQKIVYAIKCAEKVLLLFQQIVLSQIHSTKYYESYLKTINVQFLNMFGGIKSVLFQG